MWILIYVSMYLYSYRSTHVISGLPTDRTYEQLEVRIKLTIEWTEFSTPALWSREFGDDHEGCDRVSFDIHLETENTQVCRYTWRL